MNLASNDSPCRWVWRGCLQQLVLGRLDCSTLKCGTQVCELACMVRASHCCGLAAPPPCINRSPGFNGVSLSPACRFLFGNLFNDGLGPLVLLSYPHITLVWGELRSQTNRREMSYSTEDHLRYPRTWAVH